MAELVYPPVIGMARTMFKALDLRFDIKGTENIPQAGGAVLVSNHIGYLDFVFCGLTARPAKRLVRFMAKESVFRHKVSGPLMRAMKHIPVDRAAGMDAYKHALKALRSGEIIGVFPEATISRSFALKNFKSGATGWRRRRASRCCRWRCGAHSGCGPRARSGRWAAITSRSRCGSASRWRPTRPSPRTP